MEHGSDTFSATTFDREDEDGNPRLKKVINDIFLSCDSENNGVVSSSKLIEFITPFLSGDTNALEELKKSLDPDGSDPTIDIGTFYSNMHDWTNRISAWEMNDDLHDVTPTNPTMFDGRDIPFVQSTPKSSFGHHLLKNYVESGIINLSSCSSYSLTDEATPKRPDRTILEENIQELEHQNKKVVEELNRIKAELANCLDINENLEANLNKTLKKLCREQKVNEDLKMERKRGEDKQEELVSSNKQVVRLEKLISMLEKQNNQLKNELDEMKDETQKLEDKIARLARKDSETLNDIVVLQTEIEMRKQEVSKAQETNETLMSENRFLQDVIEKCNCEIDKLKVEKATLEKFLKERVDKNESLLSLNKKKSRLNFNSAGHSPNQDGFNQGCVGISNSLEGCVSEEDLAIKLHFMANNIENNESLLEEISKATSEEEFCSSVHECEHRSKWLENEKKVLNLQCELMQHQTCTFIIEKQTEENKSLLKENTNYHTEIDGLKVELRDVKTQLSLSLDKEGLLLERYRALEESFDSSKTYISDVKMKLTEYTDLKIKCKALEAKIEELETENSNKYVKIVELTIAIDKMKKGERIDSKSVEELLSQREDMKSEKKSLEDNLKILEEEKVNLKMEMETLLAKIINYEEERKDWENEKENLKQENEDLVMYNSNHLRQIENLKEEIVNLKTKISERKNNVDTKEVSPEGLTSTSEKEQNDLVVVNLKLKLEVIQRENDTIIEDRRRLADEIRFVNQERDNMLQEIKRLRSQMKDLKYHAEEVEELLDRTKKDLSASDSEKRKLESEFEKVKNDLHEQEELSYMLEKAKSEFYVEKREKEEIKNELNKFQKINEEYDALKLQYEELAKRHEDECLEKTNLNKQINTLKKDLDEYLIMRQRQEKEIERSKSEIEVSKRVKENFETEVEKLKKDLDGLKSRNEEINYSLEQARSETDTFKNDKSNLEREHEKLKLRVQQFEELSQRCAEMSTILEKTRKEYDILKVTHEICEENRKELQLKAGKDLENFKLQMAKLEEEKLHLERGNLQLRSRIESLENQITELKEKISFYQNEKNESDDVKYSLVRENQDLSSKLEKNEMNSKKQDIENKQLSVENFGLKMKIEKSDATIASLTSMNDKLKLTNEESNNQLENQNQRIFQLKGEVEKLKRGMKHCEKEKEKLSKEIERLNVALKNFDNAKRIIQEREGVIIDMQKDVVLLKENKEHVEEEVLLLKETCYNYKNKVEEMENLLKNTDGKLKRKIEEIKDREGKISKLEKEILNKDTEKNDLGKDLEAKKEYINVLQMKKEENQKQIHELNKKYEEQLRKEEYISQKFNDLEKTLIEEKTKNNQAKELLAILENEVQKLRGEEKSNSSKIKLLKENLRSLEVENKTLKGTFDNSHEELITLVEEKSKLTIQINRLIEENDDLKEECKKYTEETEEKAKMIEKTNKSFSDALKKMLTAEQKLSESDDDFVAYFKNEIEKYKRENEKFKNEISALVEEKQAILQRLKSMENENLSTKTELEYLLTEKESWLSQKIDDRKKESVEFSKSKSAEKLTPRSTFEKLNLRKEKLEEKVSQLEEQLLEEKETLSQVLSKKIALEKEVKSLNVENARLSTELRTLEASRPEAQVTETGDHATDRDAEMVIKELQLKLESAKLELVSVKEKWKNEERIKSNIVEQAKSFKDNIAKKRFRLERFTLSAVSAFKIPDSLSRKVSVGERSSAPSTEILAAVDKEIARMKDQVDVTSNALDYLIKQKGRMSCRDLGVQTDDAGQHRRQRSPKLTLRPPTLILRSTPDESSDEMNRIEDLRFASSGDAGRSPDLGVRLLRRGMGTEEDSVSSKDDDSIDQEASPTLNENALEDLGLLGEDVSLKTLSRVELEQKFNQLVLAFTIDNASLKKRYHAQTVQLKNRERRLVAEIKNCRKVIERYLQGEQLSLPSAHLETVLKQYVQVSISATLYGCLKHEVQMVNCVGLMMNYSAHLKKQLEEMEVRLQSTEDLDSCVGLQLSKVQEMPTLSVRSISTQSVVASESDILLDTHGSPRPTSRVKGLIITCFAFWMILMVLTSFILLILGRQGYMIHLQVPWSWRNYDDTWVPMLTKRYIDGPPPT